MVKPVTFPVTQYELTTGNFENSHAGAPGYMTTAYDFNDIYSRSGGI